VLIFVLMMTHIVTDARAYRFLTWAIIVGTFYLAHTSFTAGPNSFLDGRLNDIGGPDFDRAPELGVHFVAMLPFIAVMLVTDQHWVTRGFLVVTAALTFNGIVLTRTRSAMTAIIAGMVWALLRTPKRWRIRFVCVGLVGLVGAYSLTDQAFWERMGTIFTAYAEQSAEVRNDHGQVITAGRIPTWKAAWAMWKAHPLGVGIGNFNRLIENYPPAFFAIDAHNTIVLCFAELGVLGITVFLALLIGTFAQIRRLKQMIGARPHLGRLRLDLFALELSIVMFLVGGMTVSRFNCEMFWCLLAMPICLERVIVNDLRRTADAPERAASPAYTSPAPDLPLATA
jgi:O-antigen ligase